MQAGKEIKFYRMNDPYGEFSNFARFPIELDGKIWPTTEHYYQAQKYTDETYQDAIRKEPNPGPCRRMGQINGHGFKTNWDDLKEHVMRVALEAKFSQYPKLKALLMSTDDAILIEHTTNDRYWGDGGDGTGKNRLGNLLMELRQSYVLEQVGLS